MRRKILPCTPFSPWSCEHRGGLSRLGGTSAVGNLPLSIAFCQRLAALSRLTSLFGGVLPVELSCSALPACGQGSFIFLKGEYQQTVSGCTVLGARGKPAQAVKEEAAAEFLNHHATGMPVDPHLADQLVP